MVRPSHAHGVKSADNSPISSQDVVNITEETSGQADVYIMAPHPARDLCDCDSGKPGKKFFHTVSRLSL